MTEEILIGIVSVIALGIGAQWLAWQFKLPSILLLLIFGFLAGPVTGIFPSESLQGDWLYAFVSVSIGIILFEGGLSLRLSELREVGTAVLNLVTIGVLVTWGLAGLAAYFIAGFSTGLAILVGAILTVTGPTVVVPLLRQVRPAGRIGAIAKWEGITIDPVGAILAVLVLEAILLLNQPVGSGLGGTFESAAANAIEGLLLTIVISVGISVIGTVLLVFLMYRRLVPDYLQSAIALAVVVGTFGLSNVLQEESGLLEVTLMGIMMANQKYVPVRRITEFKEDLQVLLIGSLFILLSARLDLEALNYMRDPRALAFLAVIVLLIRPAAVVISTFRTRLNWKEKSFLAWLAPRGIVAAAVASLFAFRMERIYPGEAAAIVPIVFLVIVGTVAIYGLTISPLARWLGLAHPNPQGVLFLGGSVWVQRLAAVVQDLGFRVLLIDSNAENIDQARQRGIPARTADALAESIVDELDLGGIGRFLALTPNDEVNSLACLNFSELFESNEVFQLAATVETRRDRMSELPQHLRGRPLFGEDTTYSSLSERFASGGELRVFTLDSDTTYDKLLERYDNDLILLFVARGTTELLVHSQLGLLSPQAGDSVVVFLPPFARTQDFESESAYEHLVADGLVIDLKHPVTFERLAQKASALFAQRLPVTARTLVSGFIEGARYGAMPIAAGIALPHYRLPNIDRPELLLVRCRDGLHFDMEEEAELDAFSFDLSQPVYAIIFLVSPQEHPGQHLRTLASLATRIDEDHFIHSWRSADNERELKETLLDPERYASFRIEDKLPASKYIGRRVDEFDTAFETVVSLIERGERVFLPNGTTVIDVGDVLTVTGDPVAIRHLSEELDLEEN